MGDLCTHSSDGGQVFGGDELVFHVGTYFEKIIQLKKSAFLDKVPVSFVVSNENENFHIPLIFSPFYFSSYRGS